jgi:hypothetical protein
LFALIMLWIVLTTRQRKGFLLPPMSSAERTGWLFFSIPMAGFVVAKFGTNAFFNRYFIGMLPGIVFAFSCLLWRNLKELPRVSIGILLIFSVVGAWSQVRAAIHPEAIAPPSAVRQPELMRQVLLLEDKFYNDGKQYIVLSADDILGFEVRYYAKHPERYVLLLEKDPNIIAKTMVNWSHFSPLTLWQIDDLKLHGREAALIDPSSAELSILKQAGFEADSPVVGPPTVVYLH